MDKPSGLLTHRTRIASDRTTCMSLLRDQLGRWVYPVHRLDRGTSGVILFALDAETASLLGRAFEEGAIRKEYLAVVRGFVEEAGRIDHPLSTENGKSLQAETAFERLATSELASPVGRYATARYSLVKARPLTGRTHQIRRHFKHLAHPLIGDRIHGDSRHNAFVRGITGVSRLLLHASRIEFPHPETAKTVVIEAPADPELSGAIAALRL